MPKTIIAEGKTTNDAISNGLKKLNVSKEKVEIKILENEEKRSFFSILAPRVVKVELTLKEDNIGNSQKNNNYNCKVKKELDEETIKLAIKNVEYFLEDFAKRLTEIQYTVKYEEEFLCIEILGKNSTKLIGYRGDILNALQIIINSIANKHCEEKVKVSLNIGNYKEKREKALKDLADKLSRTVVKNGKSITLEPMVAYERKIIHNQLQQSNQVRTYSIGEEPYRKVVIAKK